MSYYVDWHCDHLGCREWLTVRPNLGAQVMASIPHGWIAVKVDGSGPYQVYCPTHKEHNMVEQIDVSEPCI